MQHEECPIAKQCTSSTFRSNSTRECLVHKMTHRHKKAGLTQEIRLNDDFVAAADNRRK